MIIGLYISIWSDTDGVSGVTPVPPSVELLDAQANELLDAQGDNLQSAS